MFHRYPQFHSPTPSWEPGTTVQPTGFAGRCRHLHTWHALSGLGVAAFPREDGGVGLLRPILPAVADCEGHFSLPPLASYTTPSTSMALRALWHGPPTFCREHVPGARYVPAWPGEEEAIGRLSKLSRAETEVSAVVRLLFFSSSLSQRLSQLEADFRWARSCHLWIKVSFRVFLIPP